ncbi:MAG: hypothetical protein Tsb0034_30050 [Ekhidna sp.]
MKKWIFLILLTGCLLGVNHLFKDALQLHQAFQLMVLFFAIQTFVLFRLDLLVPAEWTVQASLVKIVLRMLLSLAFIGVMIYAHEDKFSLVVQFIILYLIFMIFEIVTALTNLRRN